MVLTRFTECRGLDAAAVKRTTLVAQREESELRLSARRWQWSRCWTGWRRRWIWPAWISGLFIGDPGICFPALTAISVHVGSWTVAAVSDWSRRCSLRAVWRRVRGASSRASVSKTDKLINVVCAAPFDAGEFLSGKDKWFTSYYIRTPGYTCRSCSSSGPSPFLFTSRPDFIPPFFPYLTTLLDKYFWNGA